MFRFLSNALSFNVHYKDMGHTNVAHMTNFPIYPFSVGPSDLYPVYTHLFSNTLYINGGYIDYCRKKVVEGNESSNPFLTRRDFDLVLLYFILTNKIKLTNLLCKSYLYKGGCNPLTEIFKLFTLAAKLSQSVCIHIPVPSQWTITRDYSFLRAPTELTANTIKVGLKYCGDELVTWSVEKVQKIVDEANKINPPMIIPTIDVDVSTLVSSDKGGLYLANGGEYGIVTFNGLESHPHMYVWTQDGLYKYENISDYLYSLAGRELGNIQRICR